MGIDPYAARLIRIKARQLIGKAGFTRSDLEDIEQELTLDLLERLPRYDPARASRRTFIARIIDHKVARLLEYRCAARRDPRRMECSLHAPVTGEGGDTAELWATMEGVNPRPTRASDLAMDLETVLNGLPPRIRRICAYSPDWTAQEIADELGVSRRTVQRWKREIRRRCEDGGLGDYL